MRRTSRDEDERNEMMEFEVEVVVKTNRAILVSDEDSEVWFPLNEIDDGGLKRGESGTISVPMWLAEDRGWA